MIGQVKNYIRSYLSPAVGALLIIPGLLVVSIRDVEAKIQENPAQHCFEKLKLGSKYRNDIFFKPMVMANGPYKGECLDNRERRSVPVFSTKDRKLLSGYGVKMKPGHIYFANFKHKNRYFIAEYPENSIAESSLIFEKFNEWERRNIDERGAEQVMTGIVLSGHIQLRFKMKPGKFLNLYPQEKMSGGEVALQKIRDFSYVMFAVRPLSISGEKFDALGDGINQGYVLSENFMSMYDVALAYRDYVGGAIQVGQFRIENSHFNAEKAFSALLANSDRDYRSQKQTVYHTWLRNCVTSTYIGIDAGAHSVSVIGKIGGILSGILRPMKTLGTSGREWNPMFVLGNLERRGIIKPREQSEMISLNEEICDILSPQDLGDAARNCR